MATLDRIDPRYTAWTPSAAGITTEDDYIGRHRKAAGFRGFSLLRMFYTPRHRRR
ncbi:MAG: hypothetical protein M3Y06_02605 [Actinomycetota bacterium]|nr:hypothetical protein [Actinomycetota bacterium]